jgi:hypothetical protein
MPGIAQVLSASAGEVVVKKWIHLSERKTPQFRSLSDFIGE